MFGLGAIFSGLSAVLGVVAKLVPAVVEIVGAKLLTLAKALEAFFTILGLMKPDENVEEIGDKALQAEEDELDPITVENSGSYEKYKERLDEYDRLDPEKSALKTQDEKIQKGLEVMMGVSLEKFGEPMAALFPIILRDPAFYSTVGRLEGIGKVIQEDKDMLPNIVGYLSGKSSKTLENDKAFDALLNVEKLLDPSADKRELENRVEDMREKK